MTKISIALSRAARKHEKALGITGKAGLASACAGIAASLLTDSQLPEAVVAGGLLVAGVAEIGKHFARKKCVHNRRVADCQACIKEPSSS